MNTYSHTYTEMQPRREWGARRMLRNPWYLLAVLLSLLIHGGLLYYSTQWQVADPTAVEEEIGTLYRVQFRDLESEEYVSRPTHQQLREEREAVLQQQIQEMSQLPEMPVEGELEALTPSLNNQALPDADAREVEEDLPPDDAIARNLITSDISRRMVEDFEKEAGDHAVMDRIESNRIALMGRGRGTQNRIMANLPSPARREDPILSRSLSSVLQNHLEPRAPELEIDQPPIVLPPVTEILPSPKLIRPSLEPTTFKEEEQAIQEMKERYVQLDDLLDVQIFTYHHVGGEGYFQVQIRPIMQDDRLKVLPKDVIFVLDASNSIGTKRFEVIKDEIKRLLERLRPQDRFNLIGFKRDIKSFVPTLSPVSDATVRKAWQFLSPLEASGRTDIYQSLHPLVRLGTERARPLVVLLFSDGRPTVGVVNSREIINEISQNLGPSTSIYCIGTGDQMNRYLLDMLAFRNRGKVAFEKNRSELPAVVQSVFGYVEDPVLLKVQAFFEGVNPDEIYPKVLPDLYLKGELNIWGRLQGEQSISLRLVGEAFDEQKEMIVQLPIPEMDNATYEVARQWAFHKAYHLVGEMVQESENPQLIQEIRNISRTYRIGTPYSEEMGIEIP